MRSEPAAPGVALSYALPDAVQEDVETTLTDWEETEKVRRLWKRDAALWTDGDEADWLGWLEIAGDQLEAAGELRRTAEEVQAAGFRDALLLGMGGSSLCPEVLSLTFGPQDGFPTLHVLDSTDPAQVRASEQKIDLESSIFIVSSKSGSTLEPNIFKQYFFERVSERLGREEAGRRFVAITDPGSKLESLARADGFRGIEVGVESIGGRYSALSNFGMVPGAVMGVDALELLRRAGRMAQRCGAGTPARENPGLVLGAILGVCANRGRDKVTLVASPRIFDLGAWLEQLLAESTGKLGKGIIPVDREPLGAPEVYGSDRLFAYIRLESDPDPAQDAALEALEGKGHPVVRIAIPDAHELGGQFFQWEFATAVAGAILGINPFDQPDVEASKAATRSLTAAYEEKRALPAETPFFSDGSITLFADERNASELADAACDTGLTGYLRAHLDRVGKGDYVALLAYIEMTTEHEDVLTSIRRDIRDRKRAATCVGFGPRFLHSTGQAYKGGPNTGVFLQITCGDAFDVEVPGQAYSFGVVKAAQARGDFDVLAERGRRALRAHLGQDVATGLATLRGAVEQALS